MSAPPPARGRGLSPLWVYFGVVLLVALAGVAYVSLAHAPPAPPAPSFSLGSPQPFTARNTTYTKVDLIDANLTSVDLLGIALQDHGAPLPIPYLAEAPWVDDLLCGGGGLQPGMLAWAPNASFCHAEPGYWYALLVNRTGAVQAINVIVASSTSPTVPGPAWFAANSTAAVVNAGSALVLVTPRPLVGTNYQIVVGDQGQVARASLSPPSNPSPTFLLNYLVASRLCPQRALGGAVQEVVDNVTFNVSSDVPFSDFALDLTSANHTLWPLSLPENNACPSLPAPTPTNSGWFAILWSGLYRPVAYYSLGGQGPQWNPLGPGPPPTLTPSLNLTLEFLSWGGLTSFADPSHVELLDQADPSAQSWGGTLTDEVGITSD